MKLPASPGTSNADLSRADLNDAHLSQLELDQACSTAAQLPPGLTLKPWGQVPPSSLALCPTTPLGLAGFAGLRRRS